MSASLDRAELRQNRLLLRGVDRKNRAEVWFWLAVINAHTSSSPSVSVRKKKAFPYRSSLDTVAVFPHPLTGSIELPEGVEMVMPGDNITMTIELITPIAMEQGVRLAIREGGRTVGAGVVTEIIE